MKTLLIAFTGLALSGSAIAQTNTSDSATTRGRQEGMEKMHRMDKKHGMHKMQGMRGMHNMDHSVMMKDGKMMTMMGGKSMPMTETTTLSNGNMVMTDGSIKMKNGKMGKLEEGQCMMPNGKIMKMPMKKSEAGEEKKD